MSAVRSNFLKLAFSMYQVRTNLRDGFLTGSHLLCYFQEINIRKIGPGKGDGVFLLGDGERATRCQLGLTFLFDR